MKQLFFIHVPKTGGKTIKNIIKRLNDKKIISADELPYVTGKSHSTYVDFKINGYIPFCFVRHPAKWFHSAWEYMVKNRMGHKHDYYKTLVNQQTSLKEWQVLLKEVYEIMDFDDFDKSVDNLLTDHRGFIGRYFDTYTKDCRYIGRTENLLGSFLHIIDSHYPKMFDNKKKKLILSSKSINTNKDKVTSYSPEQYKAICESEEYMMKKYNYEE